MISFIKKLFRGKPPETGPEPPLRVRAMDMAQRHKPRPKKPAQEPATPKSVTLEPRVEGHIEDNGPGKNVLIQDEHQQEHTGVHEELHLVGDSADESANVDGIDPYNTGKFDRSKNWDKRFLK